MSTRTFSKHVNEENVRRTVVYGFAVIYKYNIYIFYTNKKVCETALV